MSLKSERLSMVAQVQDLFRQGYTPVVATGGPQLSYVSPVQCIVNRSGSAYGGVKVCSKSFWVCYLLRGRRKVHPSEYDVVFHLLYQQ